MDLFGHLLNKEGIYLPMDGKYLLGLTAKKMKSSPESPFLAWTKFITPYDLLSGWPSHHSKTWEWTGPWPWSWRWEYICELPKLCLANHPQEQKDLSYPMKYANKHVLCTSSVTQCFRRWKWKKSAGSLLHLGLRVKLSKVGSSAAKEFACNAGDPGLIPGLGRSSGEGIGYPLQYSGLENAMDRWTWKATVHGVPKSQIQPSNFLFYFQTEI